jgi:hypothetical protein
MPVTVQGAAAVQVEELRIATADAAVVGAVPCVVAIVTVGTAK